MENRSLSPTAGAEHAAGAGGTRLFPKSKVQERPFDGNMLVTESPAEACQTSPAPQNEQRALLLQGCCGALVGLSEGQRGLEGGAVLGQVLEATGKVGGPSQTPSLSCFWGCHQLFQLYC